MKKMGSMNAENKDAVAKQITATEILATLIAPKKRTNEEQQLHQFLKEEECPFCLYFLSAF